MSVCHPVIGIERLCGTTESALPASASPVAFASAGAFSMLRVLSVFALAPASSEYFFALASLIAAADALAEELVSEVDAAEALSAAAAAEVAAASLLALASDAEPAAADAAASAVAVDFSTSCKAPVLALTISVSAASFVWVMAVVAVVWACWTAATESAFCWSMFATASDAFFSLAAASSAFWVAVAANCSTYSPIWAMSSRTSTPFFAVRMPEMTSGKVFVIN